jgi:hypothetical protein
VFPAPTHAKEPDGSDLASWVTAGDVLSDLTPRRLPRRGDTRPEVGSSTSSKNCRRARTTSTSQLSGATQILSSNGGLAIGRTC